MKKKAIGDRRRILLLWPAGAGAIFGTLSFFRVSSKPRFESIHVLDVIGLMTAGAGLAVTIAALIMFFASGPRTPDNSAGEKGGEASN